MLLLAIMPPRWAISVARDRPSPYQERMPLLSSSLSHQPFFVMSIARAFAIHPQAAVGQTITTFPLTQSSYVDIYVY